MVMTIKPLFIEALEITEKYLGPSAERFLVRQIQFHLRKAPLDLSKEDIPKLLEWTRVSIGLLTEDKKMVDLFENEFKLLAN